MSKINNKIKIPTVLKYLVLSFFVIIDLYPLVWVLSSSFKDKITIFSEPFSLPKSLGLENYINAWIKCQIGKNFWNTVIYSFFSIILIILISSMAAFVLARVWKSKLMYAFFTLGIMIPTHAVLIPSFIIMRKLGLYNTKPGFIILMIASNLSFSIFVLTSYMKGLPGELDDAAMIDGCSYFRLYWNIVFPLARPGIATVGTLTLLNVWNEYLFANIMLARDDLKTLTQGIFALQGKYSTDYAGLCAGLVITILPMMIFFLMFQEQVIGGMTAGSVKG